MSKNYATLPVNEVRRSDRAVQEESWIKTLLHNSAVGYLATVYKDQPFINSNLYVYDEENHAIYMHTASKGRTQVNVDNSQKVCFTVTEMGRLLPADVALEFSVEYAGVVVFGTAVIIQDHTEAADALQKLLDKYAPHLKPGRDYRPVIAEELKRTAVYRINIDSWSGKKKEVAADFPGAFYFGEASDNGHEPS